MARWPSNALANTKPGRSCCELTSWHRQGHAMAATLHLRHPGYMRPDRHGLVRTHGRLRVAAVASHGVVDWTWSQWLHDTGSPRCRASTSCAVNLAIASQPLGGRFGTRPDGCRQPVGIAAALWRGDVASRSALVPHRRRIGLCTDVSVARPPRSNERQENLISSNAVFSTGPSARQFFWANAHAISAIGRAPRPDTCACSLDAVPASTRLAMPCRIAAMRNRL